MKIKIFFLIACLLGGWYVSQAYSLGVGSSIPSITLPLLKNPNKHMNLKQIRGKLVYFDFWASWCTPCRTSMRKLNNLYRKYRSRGLVIVGININENPQDALSFLKRYPASFTMLHDKNKSAANKFNLPKMPSGYLVKKGKIIRTYFGSGKNAAKEISELIQK